MISLVVGLGNIGDKYKGTRHNLGFELLDIIKERLGGSLIQAEVNFYWSETIFDEKKVFLVWPSTYVNLSGIAVAEALDKFDLSKESLLVAYDDFSLPLGKIRFRLKGSSGGHNGMASIIKALETEEIFRLKMGIGPLPENTDPAEFVLSPFALEELENKN